MSYFQNKDADGPYVGDHPKRTRQRWEYAGTETKGLTTLPPSCDDAEDAEFAAMMNEAAAILAADTVNYVRSSDGTTKLRTGCG